MEDTVDLVLDHFSGAGSVLFATAANVADSPVTLEIVTEEATLYARGDLTITYADGRVETVHERVADSGGRAYWGVSHQLLIRDFYDRLAEDEPFGSAQRRRRSLCESSASFARGAASVSLPGRPNRQLAAEGASGCYPNRDLIAHRLRIMSMDPLRTLRPDFRQVQRSSGTGGSVRLS